MKKIPRPSFVGRPGQEVLISSELIDESSRPSDLNRAVYAVNIASMDNVLNNDRSLANRGKSHSVLDPLLAVPEVITRSRFVTQQSDHV